MVTEFLVTSFVIVITPGTGVLYTVATGLTGGGRRSLLAAVGCTLGIVPHMVAAIVGLAALLHTSAVAFQALKLLGVAYLLYMAWTLWRNHGSLALDKGHPPPTAFSVIRRAIAINILNPKLSLFFLAFLPQFVGATSADPIMEMTVLSAVFMAMTLIVFVGYGVSAAVVRRTILARPKLMASIQRAMAVAFAGLGVRLAFAQP